MRVPICSLNLSRPGTRYYRDNLVRVQQARTYILSRIVPLAKLDQRHHSSLRILIVSFITQLDTNLLLVRLKMEGWPDALNSRDWNMLSTRGNTSDFLESLAEESYFYLNRSQY
jgi:hypothetical protein